MYGILFSETMKLTSLVGELVGDREGLLDGDPVGLSEGEWLGLEVG